MQFRKIRLKPITTIFLFLWLIFISSTIHAHGVGQSFPKEVGDYIVEFEYDTPEVLQGEVNSYIFRILNKTSGEPVAFDSLLVRFEKKSDQSTYLVTRLAQDELQIGIARLTANLNKDEYVVSLSFKSGEERIAETDYELVVLKSNKRELPIIPIVSFIGGIGVGIFIWKRITRSI